MQISDSPAWTSGPLAGVGEYPHGGAYTSTHPHAQGSIVEEGEAADEKKQGGGAADNKPEVATGEETKEAAASKASSDEAKPT